jgi:hypothetical protein
MFGRAVMMQVSEFACAFYPEPEGEMEASLVTANLE